MKCSRQVRSRAKLTALAILIALLAMAVQQPQPARAERPAGDSSGNIWIDVADGSFPVLG